MIYMEDRHVHEVKKVLAKYPYTFYAFGSRVTGKQKKFSDLDLCYIEPIPPLILGDIREDFDESNLPFKVELVDFYGASSEFQERIRADLALIQRGKKILS